MAPKQYPIFARNVTLEEVPKQSVLKKIAATELPSCSLTNDFFFFKMTTAIFITSKKLVLNLILIIHKF